MFSDELAGNASRRRQEQTRARRRKLKEQKKISSNTKEKNETQINESTESNTHVAVVGASSYAATKTNSVSASNTSAPKSAVAKAADQRKLRSFQKLHNTSATTIQAFYRAYKSNIDAVAKERVLLEKRISDLMTLSKLFLKQKKDFAPSPSLVSLMVNQMLFITHSTPRYRKVSIHRGNDKDDNAVSIKYFCKISNDLTKKDGYNIASIVENAILPGLMSTNEHLDISLVWIETKEAQIKFTKFLRLCCHLILARQSFSNKKTAHLTMPFVAGEKDIESIYKLFEIVLGNNKLACARPNVVAFCTDLFLSKIPSISPPIPLLPGQIPIEMDTLNLFDILRSFLLYPSGKKLPVIPSNAERDRRECFPRNNRDRATGLFSLLSNLVVNTENVNLRSRFVTEIYTVPLLTWRIHQSAIDGSIGKRSNQGMPAFVQNLSALLKVHHYNIVNDFAAIFASSDIPMSICPSPPLLSLCANIASFAVSSPNLNGKDRAVFDRNAATIFFDFMSILVDAVPLGAFSSRENEMGWIEQASHFTPVVLSSVVRDQCKLFLVDSFTREIFNIASNSNKSNIDAILKKKDANDNKLEQELEEIKSKSTVTVAAQEAMVNRSTGFWKKSNWAKQLSKKVTNFLSADEKGVTSSKKGKDTLMNTTEMSRKLAKGLNDNKGRTDAKNEQHFNPDFLFSVSRTYAIIVSRWGGGGHNVIMGHNFTDQRANGEKHKRAMEKTDPIIIPLLNVLSFSTSFIQTSWAMIQSNHRVISNIQELVRASNNGSPIRSTNLQPAICKGSLHFGEHAGSALLLLFNSALGHTLIITDDAELHDLESPLPIHQIRRTIVLLKNLLYRACCFDVKNEASSSLASDHVGFSLISYSAKVLRDLYDRSSRRLLCSPKTWLINDLLDQEIRRSKTHEDYLSVLNEPVLKLCPFLVSFKRRLKLFEQIILSNKESIQGRNDGHSFRPGIHVHIMRSRVLEDGLIHLNKLGSDLRKRIIVHYVNAAGSSESGLDAGGLFKEFWTDLSNQSLNPNWALFRETDDGFLFPNPSSRAAHGSDSIMLFEFLGRILGKAIYEGITIQPQFAHFFLSFLRGDYNFLRMLADLSTLDNTLYNNLMFLKTYDGDAEDLCLSFAVTKNDFGNNVDIPLIAGGDKKDVTNRNKHHYIELVAKHYVCDQVKEQSEAFRRGLWDVLDKQWIKIFNEPELQVVISGATDGSVDVEDMKANTKYAGGYTIFDRNIHRFWKVVASFDKQQRADLLRFVTSCERAPPLGFASMRPPFTIQRVAIDRDDDKLPTSSTCFNVLKLPTYSKEKVLREKLLTSIQSGSGFELT